MSDKNNFIEIYATIQDGIDANGNNKVSRRILVVFTDEIDANGNDRASKTWTPLKDTKEDYPMGT